MPIRVRYVDWTPGRERHIGRHGVVRDEVDEVLYGDHFALRANEGRYRIYGQTFDGRYLFVVASPLPEEDFGPDAYYVVTARNATEAEGRLLRRSRGGR